MPRNLKGGNKAKKKSNKDSVRKEKKDIPLPLSEENSHVAKVTSVLGDKRFNIIILSDTGLKNETMMSHLSRTASRRQGRIMLDSVVKVSKRDFEEKCDILYKYDESEIQHLIQQKIISIEERQNEDSGGIEFSIGGGGDEEEFNISDI